MGESSNNPPPISDQTSTDDAGIYQRSGKITLCLNKASDFIDNFEEWLKLREFPIADPIYINGLPWALSVELNENTVPKELDFYVICDGDSKDMAWSCSAFFEIYLFSTALGRNIKQCEFRHTFDSGGESVTCSIDVEELTNPETQFIDLEKDTITATAEIVAEEPRGIGEIRNDNVLRVNDTPVHINKHYLAAYSSYFRTLFFGENAPEEPTIQIDDLPDGVKHFKRMLATMDPENRDIETHVLTHSLAISHISSDDCIEPVLHLANRFLINVVENRCVQFIVKKSKKSPIFKFRLADKYGFSALKKHILRNLDKDDFTGEKYGENVSEQSKLSQEAADELMRRYNAIFRPPPPKRSRRN